MAKKKVTETDCQRLVKEIQTEERVKLEERFKEAYKDSKQILDKKTKWVEFCKERLVEANKELSNAEENLNELETADLDQWGKENPEPKSFNAKVVSSLTFRESQQDSIDSLRYLLSNMRQMPMGLYPVSHGL